MAGRENSRRALVAVGAAVAVLAFWNWHLAFAPVDISPLAHETKRSERPRPQEPALATPMDKKPLLAFRETVNRPLFVPDRKPVRRDQAQAKAADTPANMRLVGVVKVGDAPGRALIRMASDPRGKWIAEGEQFDGWKLRQVTARSAIVEFAGRSHELTLPSPSRAAVEGDGEPAPERPQ
jgi:hypothetical protein